MGVTAHIKKDPVTGGQASIAKIQDSGVPDWSS